MENIKDDNRIKANALLDSGATGSCINRKFVEQHQLPIQKLPIKMPVYNADGTLNADGSIEGFIKVRMVIGDHAEQIELAVTNLGTTDVFLGLDWLRFHNPTVDWSTSTVKLDRCPSLCTMMQEHVHDEDDEEEEEDEDEGMARGKKRRKVNIVPSYVRATLTRLELAEASSSQQVP